MTKNEINLVDALEELTCLPEDKKQVTMAYTEPDGTPDVLYFQKGWDDDINVYDYKHDFLMSFSKNMKMSIAITMLLAYLDY